MHAADDNCREMELVDAMATLSLGSALADCLPQVLGPATVVYLEGDLGAGKTTLVSGLLQGLGAGVTAKSPTYTLVEPYVVSGLNLYHFDFYRFNLPEEFIDAGLEEYFSDSGLCLVEWPGKGVPYVPAADLRIRFEHVGGGRLAHLEAGSARGWSWLSRLQLPLVAPSSAAAVRC